MDGRKYRCYILNGGLSDWLVSETATLSVNEKTVLSEVSKPAYVFENSSVEVSVKARADTSIVYKWQRYENKAWVDETTEAKIAAEESVLKLKVAGSSLSAPTNFRCLVWSGNRRKRADIDFQNDKNNPMRAHGNRADLQERSLRVRRRGRVAGGFALQGQVRGQGYGLRLY